MSAHLYRRLLAVPPLLISVSIVVFLLVAMIPGDAAQVLAGPDATSDVIESIREDLGLDKPLPVRYAIWLGNALRGDLGRSAETHRPVRDLLATSFGNTLILATSAMAIALLVGIATGVISALQRHSLIDRLVTFIALFGNSMPTFWLGLVLILFFSFQLGLLPSSGMYSVREPPSFSNLLSHLVLPAITLATIPSAIIARVTRSSMLDVIYQEYITAARSKGLKETLIVRRHELKNAFLPVLTVVGLQFGHLLGGAVITETIFAWPGLGQQMYRAVSTRDFPLIQAGVLLVSVCLVLVNLVVDLLYGYLDPRIRYG